MKKTSKPSKSLKKHLKDTQTCLYCGERTFHGRIKAECDVIIDSEGKLIASIERDQLDDVRCSNCDRELNRDLYTKGWDYET